jgi:Tol biopolymer transport system component
MALSAGTRLAPYEILAPLGAGGMGEVYRATDTTLGREVAIKVLPAELAHDSERLARFEREAKLLASLNHPNIAHVYGFETAPLPDGSPAHFLAMELVEGEDLAERLKRGPVPVDEAIAIAKQIAEGLEEAHEKGIVHRDLKPANVRLIPDGKVKVLDFGLAKAYAGDPATGSGADLSQSPTLPHAGTAAGIILGTAAYMAPEQARGKPVDKRADVWAFGVLLYEMLTGRRAFEGEDVTEVLASVIRDMPALDALPRETPGAVRRALRRCLQKDPKRRMRDMADARVELEEASGAPRPEESGDGAARAPARPFWRRALPVAAGVLGGAALVGIPSGLGRPGAGPQAVTRLTIETHEGPSRVAVSPDGRHVLMTSGGTIHLRSLADFEIVPVAGPDLERLANPVFSPDGRSIVFSAGATLNRVPTTGGVAREIAKLATFPMGVSWSGDRLLCGLGAEGVVSVPASGGAVEQLVTLSPGEHAASPQLLPGGDALIFTLADGFGLPEWHTARIVVQSLASGRREVVIPQGSDARYLPTEQVLVYAVDGILLAVPFDATALRTVGPSFPVVEGVGRVWRGGLLQPGATVAISASGTLVYLPGPRSLSSDRRVVFTDRSGRERELALAPKEYESPRISPNGRQLALSTDGEGEAAVWLYDLSGENAIRRLTFTGRNRIPVWSPDGARLAYQSDREGDTAIFVQRADGAADAERLTTPEPGEVHVPESWSRDGRHLSYSVLTPSGAELWMHSMSDGKDSRFGDVLSTAPLNSAFSPDGRWIAYTMRSRFGGAEVFVQPVPATGARYLVSSGDGSAHHPFWSRDGREIFYLGSGGGQLMAARIVFEASVTSGNPVRVPGAVSNTTVRSPLNYDITPDGREFVWTREVGPQGADADQLPGAPVRVVLGWFEELGARMVVKR